MVETRLWLNILFRADLSKYVAHRPSVLYWVMQLGFDPSFTAIS